MVERLFCLVTNMLFFCFMSLCLLDFSNGNEEFTNPVNTLIKGIRCCGIR